MSTATGLVRWVTRAVSASVLGALLGGIPWALVTLVGWPLPRAVTLPRTLEELQRIVATPLTDEIIINLLAVAMWLIWSAFAASLFGEIAAAVRGVPARRVPVVSPLQKVAGWLLSGVTAGVLAATLTPGTLLPQAPAVAAAPTVALQVEDLREATPGGPAGPVWTSSLTAAEQEESTEHAAPVVCAGEHILVIDDRRYAYVVQKDDSLWRIAELCLGQGQAWPEIWELNKGRHFPSVGGSLIDPDLIYPGWDIHLPARAIPPPDAQEVEPAEPPVEQPTPEPPESPTAVPPPPGLSPGATPTVGSEPTAEATPAAAPTGPGESAGQAAPDSRDDELVDDETDSTALLPIAFGTALIAATLGATAAIKLRKRAAAGDPRSGRPGHQPGHRPQRADKGRVEQQLLVAAQPLDVDRLDAALRHLAAALAGRATVLPDIIGAHVTHGDVHLLLTGACNPSEPPWQADHTRWTLPGAAELPPSDNGHLAVVPTLVTVGSQATERGVRGDEHLLLDLERLGCLALDGDADVAHDLLRYVASELAMNSWSDDVEIMLAGWPTPEVELLTALNPERFRASETSIAEAVDRLRQRVRAAARALTEAGAADALAGRVHDLGGDSWMPRVLLAANPQPDDLDAIASLAGELASIGRSAIAVVTVGAVPAPGHRPDAVHTITVTGDRAVHVPFLDASLVAAGLPLDELERLAHVLSTAREGREEPVPPAPEPEPWASGTDAAGGLLPGEPAGHPEAGEPAPPMPEQDADGDRDPQAEQPVGETPNGDGGQLQGELPPTADADAYEGADPEARPSEQPAQTPAVAQIMAPALAARTDIRQRARLGDSALDTDLEAWHAPVPTRPRIRVLGPVTDARQVIDTPGEPPKPGRLLLLAEVLVYLAQCGSRGASPSRLDDDLWPGQEVKVTYRRATLSRARQWAGRREDGTPWLAEVHYRLEDGYLLDWHLFRRLRARGQAHGPAGVDDLRAALELVRGVPLEGYERIAATTRSPYSWLPTSDIDPEHIVAAIIDTAHELAHICLDSCNTTGARWAVQQAWLADPDRNYDPPWLDLIRAQAMDGHEAELAATVRELMRAREAEVEEDLDPAIYTLLRDVLPVTFWDNTRDQLPVG